MSKELEALHRIANANNHFKYDTLELMDKDFQIVQQGLLKAQKDEKIIFGIEDYINQRIKIEPVENIRKAFIEIRNHLGIIKEVVNNECNE